MQQQPPSSKKARSRSPLLLPGLLFLLPGVILIAFSVYSNTLNSTLFQASVQATVAAIPSGTPTDPDPTAPVTCDNQPMYPGQICDHILALNNSSTTTKYTYDEQKAYQREARINQVAHDREQQRLDQQRRQQPPFSLYGILGTVSCLGGLLLGFVALMCFAGRLPRRKVQLPQAAQSAQS